MTTDGLTANSPVTSWGFHQKLGVEITKKGADACPFSTLNQP